MGLFQYRLVLGWTSKSNFKISIKLVWSKLWTKIVFYSTFLWTPNHQPKLFTTTKLDFYQSNFLVVKYFELRPVIMSPTSITKNSHKSRHRNSNAICIILYALRPRKTTLSKNLFCASLNYFLRVQKQLKRFNRYRTPKGCLNRYFALEICCLSNNFFCHPKNHEQFLQFSGIVMVFYGSFLSVTVFYGSHFIYVFPSSGFLCNICNDSFAIENEISNIWKLQFNYNLITNSISTIHIEMPSRNTKRRTQLRKMASIRKRQHNCDNSNPLAKDFSQEGSEHVEGRDLGATDKSTAENSPHQGPVSPSDELSLSKVRNFHKTAMEELRCRSILNLSDTVVPLMQPSRHTNNAQRYPSKTKEARKQYTGLYAKRLGLYEETQSIPRSILCSLASTFTAYDKCGNLFEFKNPTPSILQGLPVCVQRTEVPEPNTLLISSADADVAFRCITITEIKHFNSLLQSLATLQGASRPLPRSKTDQALLGTPQSHVDS